MLPVLYQWLEGRAKDQMHPGESQPGSAGGAHQTMSETSHGNGEPRFSHHPGEIPST